MSASPLAPVRELQMRVEDWFLGEKRATYGLSFSRIAVGIAVLGILVTNLGTRYAVWGPGSAWAEGIRESSSWGGLNGLWATSNPVLFTLQYLVLMGIAVAVIVGWRTRAASVLLIIGMTALVERNPMVGDQGDNIARIGLIFLAVTTASEHWSFDARRRRRALAGGAALSRWQRWWAGLPVLPGWAGATLHNLALMALALQVFILYLASALYKAHGDLWQLGTALYYPLALHEYGVMPWANELLTSNGLILTAATYFAVFVQLFFAPALLHPYTRRVAVLAVIAMHVGIAVLMGLPWFSLSMIAFDGIFVSSSSYRMLANAIAARAQVVRAAVVRRVPRLQTVSANR